jgi:diacylglycerol kinase (ATP)
MFISETLPLPSDTKESPSASGRRLTVVFNPTAGQRRRARLNATLELLRRAGCEIALHPTAAKGDAEAIAREFGSNGTTADMLLVAGGDGTINEAVNGLLAKPNGRIPPVALVPLGTANVLAAEIGLATTPAAVAHAITDGRQTQAYVGAANGRCFTAMAGVGFDAHVVANVSLALKRRLGKGAYVLESLRQLFRFGFPNYRVTVDGQSFEAASAIVAKGHYYAGRFVCAPEARIDRPELHVCLFGRNGRWNALRYALALGAGRLHRLPDVRIVKGRSVSIEGPPGDPVQGDGDIIATLPVRIGLAPRQLSLTTPPA